MEGGACYICSTLCLCDGGVRKKFNSIALNDYSHMSFFFRFPPSLILYFSFMNVAINIQFLGDLFHGDAHSET